MARPTVDRKDVSIHVRVNAEMGEKIQQESYERGISTSDYIREKLEGFVAQNNYVAQNDFSLGGLFDEDLERISGKLGINEGALIQYMEDLIDRRTIYKDESGIVRYRTQDRDPEYISVDDAVDNLRVSQKQKDFIKKQMLGNLSAMKERSVGMSDWA